MIRTGIARAALASLLAFPALAEAETPDWQGVYDGVIGKAHIVAALAPNGSRYFYVGQKNDLGLIVSAEGAKLSATETLAPDLQDDDLKDHPELVSGRWTAVFAEGALKGVWKDAYGGREQALALTRVSSADESADADFPTKGKEPGAYATRWLGAAPALVAAPNEASIGPLTYRLMRDPSFGNLIPRLTRAPANVRTDAVNAALGRLQRDFILGDRACLQGDRQSMARSGAEAMKKAEEEARKPADWTPTAAPIFATDRLLALKETRDLFCGGAHPNLELAVYTFDLRDGAMLTGGGGADDLGPNGLGRALDIADPKKREAFNAVWMGALRAGIKAAETRPQKSDDIPECRQAILDSLEANGSEIAKLVYPTDKGLAFHVTDFPHAIELCLVDDDINPAIVPYAALKPFLKPGQTLLPESGPTSRQ